MPSGGFLDHVLDKIPGYGGYRDKERRRDTDRAIRDQLVTEYTQLSDRLGRLATQLANDRQIASIGIVDRPQKRLLQFIDRVRTATYGYAPIFAKDQVDAAALDQIARFDEALADQTSALEAQIGKLEAADPGSDDFKQIAADIGSTIQGLSDRFDKRRDVVSSGQALPERDLSVLLDKPQVAESPRAYRLHDGEAIAYANVNYSVIGRVSLDAGDSRWHALQLAGGDGDRWLQVSARSIDPMYWLQRITPTGEPGGPSLSVGADSYNLADQISGDGDVVGKQGASGRQPIRYYHYRSADGSHDLHVYRLGSTYLSLVGTTVDPAEIDVFSREQ